jgi:hypothetical protein
MMIRNLGDEVTYTLKITTNLIDLARNALYKLEATYYCEQADAELTRLEGVLSRAGINPTDRPNYLRDMRISVNSNLSRAGRLAA